VPVPRPSAAVGSSLGDLAVLVGAPVSWLGDGADARVTGVTLDSRAVLPGDLYAALPGARVHGASFGAQVAAAGAVGILTDRAGRDLLRADGVELPMLVVDGPRAVLGATAARVYGTEDLVLRMIGITGTNGKTTTAHLIHSALGALGEPAGLIGTVEARIGEERITSVRTTPESPDLHALLAVMAERRMGSCVMEVSSHALAQHRVDGVIYDIALFTNLSQDHLDFHADMEDYFAAKASLFSPSRARRGLVCVDDDWGGRLAGAAGVPVSTLTSHADREADWRVLLGGSDPASFVLRGPGTELALRSALPGAFNIVNTAMAAVALILTGEQATAVERAILTDPHVPGRMERVSPSVPDGRAPLAVVDYAHTPTAVAAALAALRPATEGPLVVVLGAGGDRDRGKRQAMGRAAAEHADVVVVTDDNPRSEDPGIIRAAVVEGALSVARSADLIDEGAGRRAAIRRAVQIAVDRGPGATVAVVGKGHETGQDIAGVIHPFDDRSELRLALDAVLRSGAAEGGQAR
jgi:UDP-N-acetylmuramoyl-L-alanyl-D-glutamate--2,6-diaminopimelate ligase